MRSWRGPAKAVFQRLGLAFPVDFARQARCVFVLSTGRVGTASLIEILATSNRVAAYHEPRPVCVGEAKRAYLTFGEPREQYLQIFTNARRSYLAWARVRRKVYVEATNMIYMAPIIAEFFPRSKFVFLHRHAADVVRSGMRRGWYQGHPWDKHRITPRPGEPAFEIWGGWDAFRKICWFWQAVNEFILTFQEEIATERIFTLSFGELIDPDAERQQALFRFLGVKPPSDHRIRSAMNRNTNAQRSGQFPTFQEWTRDQEETLYGIAGETMTKLGYL